MPAIAAACMPAWLPAAVADLTGPTLPATLPYEAAALHQVVWWGGRASDLS
jgi:hypothetical protein